MAWLADSPPLATACVPEGMTTNIAADAPISVPNIPESGKGSSMTWLATWTENLIGDYKYVFFRLAAFAEKYVVQVRKVT